MFSLQNNKYFLILKNSYFRFYGDNTLSKDNKDGKAKSSKIDVNENSDYEYEYIYVYDDDYEELKELTTSSDIKPWGEYTRSSDINGWNDYSKLSDIQTWEGTTESPKDAVIISSNDFKNTKIERTLTAGVGSNHHSNSLDYPNSEDLVDPVTSNPINYYYNSDTVDYSTEYPLWSSPATSTTSTPSTTLPSTTEPVIRWGSVTIAPNQSKTPLKDRQKEMLRNNHHGKSKINIWGGGV